MMREILVMDCAERETFWTTLKSDYKILFATTAEKGLTLLSENVGLVFLSMKLPDMDGMEVLRLIKKVYPSTAVIVITSCGTEEKRRDAFGNEAGDHTGKALQSEEILQRIKGLLNAGEVSQGDQRVSLSTETTPQGSYPDMPPHLVNGVLRVRDFVAQNYSRSLTLTEACRMASTSKTYFCRFFKHVTGHSLRRYHHVVKVKMAEELLRDERLSVTDVAHRLGYSDSNYFSTIYKKVTGISPRQRQVYGRTSNKVRKEAGRS